MPYARTYWSWVVLATKPTRVTYSKEGSGPKNLVIKLDRTIIPLDS